MIESMILLFFAISFLFWRDYNKKKDTAQPERAVELSNNRYRAIQVIPCEMACSVAKQSSNKVFLEAELKHLPLDHCDHVERCMCKFRHLEDRRQHEDRRSSSMVLQNVFDGKERRGMRKKGRRKDDWSGMSYS